MINFTPATEQDIERLLQWIESDPYHHDYLNPLWWLTGVDGSFLSFRLDDEEGPLCYVRLDPTNSNGYVRMHTQFGPREEVSKDRLVNGLLQGFPRVQFVCEQKKATGIIFQSSSPSLIGFMKKKFSFQPAGGDDYILLF